MSPGRTLAAVVRLVSRANGAPAECANRFAPAIAAHRGAGGYRGRVPRNTHRHQNASDLLPADKQDWRAKQNTASNAINGFSRGCGGTSSRGVSSGNSVAETSDGPAA